MRCTLWFVLLFSVTSLASAQNLSKDLDTTATKKVRKVNHYLGVQANQLLNQLFNFGGASTAVTNPYLIVYSVNSKETGWGLNTGLGYSVNSLTDNSDPNTTRTTSVNNFSLRAGIEKKTYLSKKWLLSAGADVLYGKQNNDTKVVSQFQFQTNTNDTNSGTRTLGLGPRVGLNYFISDHILLGTEATYYLRFLKDSNHVENTSENQGAFNTSTTDTSTKSTAFAFTVPIAIFLIVKL